MKTFVRAVVTGFGFSLGKALFEKVKDRFLPDERSTSDIDIVDAAEVEEPDSN